MLRTSRATWLVAACLLLNWHSVYSQEYPSKPLRLIVPNSPGLTADTLGRLVSQEMSKGLGQPIVVENKPGADSIIGVEFVAKQMPADGYTLLVAPSSSLIIMPLANKDLRFDPIRDVVPVIGISEARFLFGSASSKPWKTFNEMITRVKASPGKYNYGSSSTTTTLLTEAILSEGGLQVVYIPYSSGGPHMQALVVGDIDMSFTIAALVSSWGDKFRTLAVTGRNRMPELPDVPTFTELGLASIRGQSHEMYVRAGTPKPIIDRLFAAASKALQQPEVRERVVAFRQEVTGTPPEVVVQQLGEQASFYSGVARKTGLKPQ